MNQGCTRSNRYQSKKAHCRETNRQLRSEWREGICKLSKEANLGVNAGVHAELCSLHARNVGLELRVLSLVCATEHKV